MTRKKLIPLLILIGGTIAFFMAGGHNWLGIDKIQTESERLKAMVADHYAITVLIYIIGYTIITALSLPIAVLVTLIGGFLFGAYFGTLYTVIGATAGAVIIFTAAKYALSDWLGRKTEGWIAQLKDGFNQNAFAYMLTLRLIPLFPFFIVNIAPAFLGVSLRIFAVATAIGIIPGTFVYNLAGAGLSEIFASGAEFSPATVMTPKILAAFTGLGLLALAPSLYKWRKKTKKS